MNKNFIYYLESFFWLIKFFAVGLLILFFSRLIFLISYANWPSLTGYSNDIIKSFILGIKYDIKVLTIGALPLYCVSLIRFVIGNRHQKLIKNTFIVYSTIFLQVLIIFEIINFYFFKFYQSKINVIIFGFFQDDTKAVLLSIWKEYPVIPIIIGFLILCWLTVKFLIYLFNDLKVKSIAINRWLQITTVIFSTSLYFLGMRGSISMTPLDKRHATISNNAFVNTLALNGLFSMKSACTDKKESYIDLNESKMLNYYGFNSIEEATKLLYNSNNANFPNSFFNQTPTNNFLEKNKPNVVFILMESMSNFYLDMDSRDCNLLGTLKDVMDSCYLFRNFLPSGSSTIYSLESIIINSPKSPVSQSPYQNISFDESIAKPFEKKGYETLFITGGKMGWRNLNNFIPNQFFDKIEAEPTLQASYPNAKHGEWGIHDEILFRKLFDELSHSNGTPKFIFAMTISHHSPYDIPNDYIAKPIKIPKWAKSQMKYDEQLVLKSLKAYQYANNYLGEFIKKIISSPLRENTIIVATGDHNIRQLFNYSSNDFFMQCSVPLVMYVPPKYRPKNKINTNKFGSHKDIFPTLYNLALSNAIYANFGTNLFSTSDKNFALYCYSIASDSIGLVNFSSTPLFYRWKNVRKRILEPSTLNPDYHLDSLMKKAKALTACMNYFLFTDIQKNSQKNNFAKAKR